MRNAQALMLGFVVAAGAIASGCNASNNGGAVGSSEAQLVVSALGQDAATIHVIAVDDTNAFRAADETVEVKGGQSTVVPFIMTPSRYTFTVDVSGSGEQTGHASTHVTLKDGDTVQVSLVVAADNPSNPVVAVDLAPRIDSVGVQLKGGLGQNQRVEIHVDASDADSDQLSYFWSGAGMRGAVAGSSTLTIPAAQAAAAGASILHVVVQDPQGATASADIALVITQTEARGTLMPGAMNGDHEHPCQEAHAQCKATCAPSLGIAEGTVAVDGACMAACGQALAACEAPAP